MGTLLWVSRVPGSRVGQTWSNINPWFQLRAQEIEEVRVPVFNPKLPGKVSVELYPMVYPHRILAYLFNEVELEMPSCDVQTFWNHSRTLGEPWACAHPAIEWHVPVGLHGDGAKLWTQYRVEKYVAVWLNLLNLPLFRPRSIRHSRFLLFSMPKHKMVKNRSLNVFWRKVCWSLNAAFTGQNPSVGPGGLPLAGEHLERAGHPICKSERKFALTELRGDWEWHRDIWRFCASWQSQVICFRCPALTRGNWPYVYYNNSSTCRWDQEEFSLNQFVARRLTERQLCALYLIGNGFFSIPSYPVKVF